MKCLCRLVPHLIVIITIVVVFAIFGGCSKASGDSDSTNRFHGLLKLVPSDVDLSQAQLVFVDYASFYEDNDISLTGADSQPLTFQEFIELMVEGEIKDMPMWGDSFITGYGQYAIEGTIEDKYVGYNFTDVYAEIYIEMPPLGLTVAIGRFDPQAIRDALSWQDEWPSWAREAYITEEYRGVTIHSWGSGMEIHPIDRLKPPHIDTLGRARPLAVTDEFLFYAYSLEAIKSMINASQGKTESLADLPEYADIANALYKKNVYSVSIGIQSIADGDPESYGKYLGTRLKEFITLGSAPAQDDNGAYILLVIYYENPDDIQSNVALLEERINNTDSIIFNVPWSELITDSDFRVDGNLLVVRLYTENPGIWNMWVYKRQPLLLHEQECNFS